MATGKGPSNKRMRRRELERRRAQTRKVLLPAVGVAVAAVGLVTLIVLSPATGPQPEIQPGQIVSQSPMHIHPVLQIFNLDSPVTIPANIGIQGGAYADHSLDHWLDQREGAVGTLAPLHTHDTSGTIHVEASLTRGFTLGEFFSVWGQPLGPSQTYNYRADSHHRLTLNVNGVDLSNNDYDWQNVVLKDNQKIIVRYIAF